MKVGDLREKERGACVARRLPLVIRINLCDPAEQRKLATRRKKLEATRLYQKRHPERVAATQAKRTPESKRAAQRKYLAANVEKVREKNRRIRARERSTPEGREKANSRNRRWEAKLRATPEGRDRLLAKARNTNAKHRDTNPRYADEQYERTLKKKYGISLFGVALMRQAQGNRCPICLLDFQDQPRPCVDHCHVTGRVRGLLCSLCNSAIGKLRDDVDYLTRAIEYLRKAGA
jgi:hypothetical protein